YLPLVLSVGPGDRPWLYLLSSLLVDAEFTWWVPNSFGQPNSTYRPNGSRQFIQFHEEVAGFRYDVSRPPSPGSGLSARRSIVGIRAIRPRSAPGRFPSAVPLASAPPK